MHEGAQGFMHKSAPADSILAALKRLLAGEAVWLDPLAKHVQPVEQDLCCLRLTQRQIAVLSRIRLGWSNKEIARDLAISDNTVRIHVAAILQTLGVKNRSEAIIVANQLGLDHA